MGDFLSRESLIIGGVAAGITFVLTFFAGLFGGVAFFALLFRSILFTILLGVLGLIIAKVLEKVIPDIWENIENSEKPISADSSDKESSETATGLGVDYTVNDTPSFESKPEIDSVAPKDEGKISHVSVEEAESQNIAENLVKDASVTKPKVEGNYLIVDDKKFPNVPEDYAKAIRTMMKKDE